MLLGNRAQVVQNFVDGPRREAEFGALAFGDLLVLQEQRHRKVQVE